MIILDLNMTDEIKHNGTVSGIDGQMVDVTIIQMSSCVGCQAKSLCRLSEMKDKTVSVAVDNPRDYTVGQQVVVAGSVSQGMQAVVFAFGIPVILLMITLVLTLSVTGDERMTSLFSLGMLVPYYIVLFLFRDRLKRNFSFRIIG